MDFILPDWMSEIMNILINILIKTKQIIYIVGMPQSLHFILLKNKCKTMLKSFSQKMLH